MNKKHYNFIVTFTPRYENTVDKMEVIDTWESTSRSLVYASKTMSKRMSGDEHRIYYKGEGTYTVYLTI